jgi:hypothetical protein
MSNAQKYAVVKLDDKLTQYRESFHNLGPDHYHPAEDGGRTRRLAQYHVSFDPLSKAADITRLNTQLFLQGPSNKLTGHIERAFDDVLDDLKPYIENGLKTVDENWSLADYDNEWLVNCHQVRVHAKPQIKGVPVPEGIHKDGAEFVIMGCVAREGVKGGVSHIYEDDQLPPVYGVTLMPGDAIVVDDREVFHMVSPLIAENGHGYRDMILMGFHLWSHGKYKGNWRENISSLQ